MAIKKYRYHYVGDCKSIPEDIADREWTDEEFCFYEDGHTCTADLDRAWIVGGKRMVEACFDSGNMLDVWADEELIEMEV